MLLRILDLAFICVLESEDFTIYIIPPSILLSFSSINCKDKSISLGIGYLLSLVSKDNFFSKSSIEEQSV
jgi:hypothetical protein